MSIYEEIKQQFYSLSDAAGLEIIEEYWDEYTHDNGVFKLASRKQAHAFCLLMPPGYEANILGPTNSVDVEIV